MNCMRIDPNYMTSKNGKHRKELKAVLRSIYDSLGRYPGYRTVMAALHERGYTCGQQMAVGECYSVASLTVCEFGFQDRKPWRLTSDTKYRECLPRYVSSFGERY